MAARGGALQADFGDYSSGRRICLRFSKQDMSIQREHLAASLALIARNIEHLDILAEPSISGFGAKPADYLIVREAMLDALADALGERFTPEVRADWFEALNRVIALMLRGAINAAAHAPRVIYSMWSEMILYGSYAT